MAPFPLCKEVWTNKCDFLYITLYKIYIISPFQCVEFIKISGFLGFTTLTRMFEK